MTPFPRAESLVDLLRARAEQRGEDVYLEHLVTGDVDGPRASVPFGALERRARAIAARLEALGLRGQRVILIHPPGPSFLEAILGCFHAGAVAVPVALPDPARITRAIGRLSAMVANADAGAVLVSSELAALLPAFAAGLGLERLPVVVSDSVPDEAADAWSGGAARADDLAMLQYTSGSTGTPRGVMLTHGNLVANLRAIHTASASRGRIVSWLPPYHDMGLIGCLFWPLATGHSVVTFSPLLFLQRPMRWLEALSAFRAAGTAGPDFALALVTRRATDEEIARLDLRAFELCWCGAEPVRAETLRAFHARFAPAGLRAGVVCPAYGLAEATLLVAHHGGSEPVLPVDAAALSEGRVVRREGGRELVGNGPSVPGTAVIAVDAEARVPCPPDVVGELWVRGPAVAAGYWRRPDDTARTFGATLASGDGPWLRTGDLGLVDAAVGVVVCGRSKDVLIVRGRNIYPQDVEATVEAVGPAVRPGCAVAFAVKADDGAEQLGVAVELRKDRAPADLQQLADAIREAILDAHDVSPALIALLPPGELPKTTSGKVQRRATGEAIAEGRASTLLIARTVGPDPLYAGLAARTEKLDARGLGYQFDLERDIAWDAVDAPGVLVPPDVARSMLGDAVDAVHAAGAWPTTEVLLAMAISRSFVLTEVGVIEFLRGERALLGEHRSLDLFVDEELKHIALFERLDAALRRRHPALGVALDRYWGEVARPVNDPALVPAPAARHLEGWTAALFFECWTVWLAQRLRASPAAVQPTWLSAHVAHAREEVQHVITDKAWLACHLGTAESERRSAASCGALLDGHSTLARAVLRAARDLEPQLGDPGEVGIAESVRLLSERAFRPCTELIPFFDALRRAEGSVVDPAGASARGRDEILTYIQRWVARELGCPVEAVAPDASFARLGLDSVARIGLAAGLGAFLEAKVSEVAAYTCPTPGKLADTLAVGVEQASGQPAAAAHGDLASARQARLVRLDAALGGAVVPDHLVTAWRIEGTVDVDALTAALRDVVIRHEALRTRFVVDGEQVRQVVDAGDASASLQVHDADEVDAAARALLSRFDTEPYDLAVGPLWRAALVRGAGAVLALGLHHAVGDAWSMDVLMRDLAAAYAARLAGASAGAPRWPALTTTPRLLAAEEAALLAGDEGARRLAWWRGRLGGHPSLGRAGRTSRFDGRGVWRQITPARREAWTTWATDHGDTLPGALLAALHLALAAEEAGHDRLVCAHLADRPGPERRALVGYLVNVLPLRTEIGPDTPLVEALARVRRTWVDAVAHELPIDVIVGDLAPDRDATRFMPAPLAFNYIPVDKAPLVGAEARFDLAEGLLPVPSFQFFDRMIVARPDGAGLTLGAWVEADAVGGVEALLEGLMRRLDGAARG